MTIHIQDLPAGHVARLDFDPGQLSPNPGTIGGAPETTFTSYNTMLQPITVTQPDGTTVSSSYLLTGELGLQYGSRTYPVAYSYDYTGRMKTMTNWSNFSGNSGMRVTTWNYDSQRGWLTSKIYDDGHGPSYAYYPAGKLKTRTWVRTVGGQALTTTYGYDNADDLTSVSYSDSTPSVATVYDRLGRQSTITFNGTTDTLTYNLANQLLGESYSGGILAGLAVTNGYDSDLRRTALAALQSNNPLIQQSFGFDAASRLSTVSDSNNNSATYSYVANSPLVSQITFKQNGTTRMTTTKQYDYLNRLTSISSTSSQLPSPISYAYAYNSANQRTRDTLADGSYWIYQYDSLGQVTSANKYWSDQTPVAGQQFDYAFDTIGNRTQTKTGGDQHGGNLRTANYYANTLNQYTSRDVPGYLDIKGLSFATNTVTVNGNTAYRKGEYFRDELSVNNSSSPVWEGITVAATGQPSVSGNEYVPQTPENFGYDADGNLTSDGRWTYVWDAENRLISLTANTSVGPQEQIVFAYDAQGRRIEKVVSLWNGSVYVPQSTNIFLYDGWNLVAEVGPGDSLIRSYVWGTDLSGSMQGAGGVGGLLEVSYGSTNCFVAYDGNGNVAGLVNAADGTVDASYEYGPFGEVVRQTGPMAKLNPIRWSTKYQDDESDIIMYPYRPYKASTGTWLSRDPMQEMGGLNLYEFADNDGINKYDTDGGELGEAGEAVIADLAVQISVNYATGKHWYHISASALIVAGGLGFIGIPDIKDTGQIIRGIYKTGKISITASKRASGIELLSNPKSIARLNAELDKMTVQQSKALMQTLKTGGLIGADTAATETTAELSDYLETAIVTMPGCPNQGYGGIVNVNIVQTVYYVPPGN